MLISLWTYILEGCFDLVSKQLLYVQPDSSLERMLSSASFNQAASAEAADRAAVVVL
jgi:hypothetical protein